MKVQKTSHPNSEGSQLSPSVILARPLPDPFSNLPSPGRAYRSAFTHDLIPQACHECGQALVPRQRKFCSHFCADTYRAEMRRVLPISAASALSGAIREVRVREEPRSAKLRRIADARRAREDMHQSIGMDGRRRAEMAAREQLRRWYAAEVKPRLLELQPKDIPSRHRSFAHICARNNCWPDTPPTPLRRPCEACRGTGSERLRLPSVSAEATAASQPLSASDDDC